MADRFVTLRRVPLVVATFALATFAGAVACTPTVQGMRMGATRPRRAPDCSLDIVSPTDFATIQKYEQVGVVVLSNEEAGTDPMSPQARAIVRPRACALGGDAISLMGSGNVRNPTSPLPTTAFGSYVVWAKRAAPGAAPQKF
jgi:hypothetical protein